MYFWSAKWGRWGEKEVIRSFFVQPWLCRSMATRPSGAGWEAYSNMHTVHVPRAELAVLELGAQPCLLALSRVLHNSAMNGEFVQYVSNAASTGKAW